MAVISSSPISPATPPFTTSALTPQLLTRIRAEYREMPGLRLTLLQARRLWGVDIMTCSAALTTLEASGFLASTRDGAFVLADAGRMTA
jgi:hypothetical protein